jgi:hypothetical protein
MTTKYTPGPWEWLGGKYELTALRHCHPDGGGNYVIWPEAEVSDYGLSVTVTLDVSPADARLIAAAPELVEALRDAANRIDDMIECDAPGLAWSEARKSAARSRALLARIEGDEA